MSLRHGTFFCSEMFEKHLLKKLIMDTNHLFDLKFAANFTEIKIYVAYSCTKNIHKSLDTKQVNLSEFSV